MRPNWKCDPKWILGHLEVIFQRNSKGPIGPVSVLDHADCLTRETRPGRRPFPSLRPSVPPIWLWSRDASGRSHKQKRRGR